MKTQNENSGLTPPEKLKSGNELLKKKLTNEFGMKSFGSELPDDVENQWLNYIYDFEKMYKDAKRVKVCELIGSPEFKPISQLNKDEITSELERLLNIMFENSIVLNTICDYEDEVIYKFITEELFQEETDDMQIEGMRHCFIYEEFHPNPKYDLEHEANELFESIFERQWDDKFDIIRLCRQIIFNGKHFEIKKFSEIVLKYQKLREEFADRNLDFHEVNFNVEEKKATVAGNITYLSNDSNIKSDFTLNFEIDDLGYWIINQITMPGFNF